MASLLMILIQKYEIGFVINCRDGMDFFWSGPSTIIHLVEDDQHVWIKQSDGIEGFSIGYGLSPVMGPAVSGRDVII
jgi:hypothetical protein